MGKKSVLKPRVLTIAGSDSSGGAGIQADLRTFNHFGVWGLSAVTALTAQNSSGVVHLWAVDPRIVYDQILCLREDPAIDGIKIGMLTNSSVLRAVIDGVKELQKSSEKPIPVVVDPVLISSSGFPLLEKSAVTLLKKELFPLSTVLTPNIPEAESLLSVHISHRESILSACRRFYDRGVKNILIKGGHGTGGFSEDILFDGNGFTSFKSRRLEGDGVHGSGCVLSSALCANLARGHDLVESVRISKAHIFNIIKKTLS
jgi:hydroxymethylpyrimidine/phosphomethylpyrimidine kinase